MGLSKSYGSGLSSGYGAGTGYSFSSGYTPNYNAGYSSYLSRASGYYTGQSTPSSYKKNYEPNTQADRNGYAQSSSSSNWRSKSIETNGYRDSRSMSRDTYSSPREHSVARDGYQNFSDNTRESSVGRDRFNEYASMRDFTPSRDYTPARDFSRRGSVGADALPLPPPRMKKYGLHKSASNLPTYDSASRFNNATASLNGPLSRSSSFHDLQDPYQSTPKARPRLRTLTYGVSESDLAQARSAIDLSSSRGSLSDLKGAAAWKGSNRDLRGNPTGPSFDFNGTSGNSSMYGLDSLSKSTLDLGYISQPSSRRTSIVNVPTSSSQTSQEFKTKSNLKSQNGEIDYKKLWEESQAENARLRLDMNAIRSDLDSTRHQLEAAIQASAKNSVSDTEKREKKVLEKKLAEMEEELKQLQKLKSENEKLKSENRALTRVVSKLTAAATKSGSSQPSQGPQVRK